MEAICEALDTELAMLASPLKVCIAVHRSRNVTLEYVHSDGEGFTGIWLRLAKWRSLKMGGGPRQVVNPLLLDADLAQQPGIFERLFLETVVSA
jgi:hypothetical protein